LIEKVSGHIAYAVMSFGGFPGLAHSHYPISWSALKYDTALGCYRTGITESQLRDAPEFSDDSWTDRDWEMAHLHIGVPENEISAEAPRPTVTPYNVGVF
jgi:hypothetical protein